MVECMAVGKSFKELYPNYVDITKVLSYHQGMRKWKIIKLFFGRKIRCTKTRTHRKMLSSKDCVYDKLDGFKFFSKVFIWRFKRSNILFLFYAD